MKMLDPTVNRRCRAMVVGLVLVAATAGAQREPHVAYLYPAGCMQGATVEVTAGGQMLRGVTNAVVSGTGIHVLEVRVQPRAPRLDTDQRRELARRLRALVRKRWAEMSARKLVDPEVPWASLLGEGNNGRARMMMESDSGKPNVELPDHPLLRDLDKKSIRELRHVRDELLTFKRRQFNSQLAETVLVRLEVDPDTACGDREIRLVGRRGMTNPMCFEVGALAEVYEQEPNDPEAFPSIPTETPLQLPVILNGQIMPGDVDRFRFTARKGQRLVIETHARKLVPYLADAVPGWFQAVTAVYDRRGRELAFADDYRFMPDPVLCWLVPEDGEYELEIRDAIYRGREDFVYRIAVGELPFVTEVFPLGGREGRKTVASVKGWNLPCSQLSFDTRPGPRRLRQTSLSHRGLKSNPVMFAVDNLEEVEEVEPNDLESRAQPVSLPRIVNGRIGRPGDTDVFRFRGHAGEMVVAEVTGRRLCSPLDSVLRLQDVSGRVVAWNDDSMTKEGHVHTGPGWMTHHADACLRACLPRGGTYYVHLTDVRQHGGDAYAYRLRLSPPQPDFELKMTPSSLGMHAGRWVPVTVYALRRDGFEGDVEVSVTSPSDVFVLSGATIPAGATALRMTLAATRGMSEPTAPLELEGRAVVDGRTARKAVTPVEDRMQAFLWRHLVPARELITSVEARRWTPVLPQRIGRGAVRVRPGGQADVQVKGRSLSSRHDIDLVLCDPPAGVTIDDVAHVPGGLSFSLCADSESAPAGLRDNLIIEAFAEREVDRRGSGGTTKRKHRYSLGVLPAIPLKIVER